MISSRATWMAVGFCLVIMGAVSCLTELPSLKGFPCETNTDCSPGLECLPAGKVKRCHEKGWSYETPSEETRPGEAGPEAGAEPVQEVGPEAGPEAEPVTKDEIPERAEPVVETKPEQVSDEPPPACKEGDKKDCGVDKNGIGECKKGKQTCVNGKWGLCDGILPMPEYCGDRKDNDCDGLTDDKDKEGCVKACDHNKLAYTLQPPHATDAKGVAFSPDNKWMVTVDSTTIRVWTMVFPTVEKRFFLSDPSHYILANKHSKPITTVAFSLDPSFVRFATGDEDGNIRVWDPSTRKQVFHLKSDSSSTNGHSKAISGLQFLFRQGTQGILISCSKDATCREWDLNIATPTSKKLSVPLGASLKESPFSTLSCARTVEFCAMGMISGRTLFYSGGKLTDAERDTASITNLAVSFNGTLVARTSSKGNTIEILVGSGEGVGTVGGNFNLSNGNLAPTAMLFHPGKTELLIGAKDGTLLVFDGNKVGGKIVYKKAKEIRSQVEDITALGYRADGKWLASVSKDRSIEVRGGVSRELIFGLWGATSPVLKLVMWPDGKFFAMVTGSEVVRWDLGAGTYNFRYDFSAKSSLGPVVGFSVSPLRNFVAWARGKSLFIWDFQKNKQPLSEYSLNSLTGRITSFAWHPDDRYIFLGADATSENLLLWGVAEQKVLDVRTTARPGPVTSISFSLNGENGIVVCGRQAIFFKLLQRTIQQTTTTFANVGQNLLRGGFVFDSILPFYAYSDGTIKQTRNSSGALETMLPKQAGLIVKDISFDPTLSRVALALANKGIQVWQLSKKEPNKPVVQEKLLYPIQGNKSATAVSFDTSGRLLIAAFDDKTIEVHSCECARGQTTFCKNGSPYHHDKGACQTPGEQACFSTRFFLSCNADAPLIDTAEDEDNNCNNQKGETHIDLKFSQIIVFKGGTKVDPGDKLVRGDTITVTACPEFSGNSGVTRDLDIVLYMTPKTMQPAAPVPNGKGIVFLTGESPLKPHIKFTAFPLTKYPDCKLLNGNLNPALQQTITIPTDKNLVPNGTWYLQAYVDWGDKLRESLENNNYVSVELEISSN